MAPEAAPRPLSLSFTAPQPTGCQNMKLCPLLEGAPNFRQVEGLPVYGVAIPTVRGVRTVLDQIGAAKGERAAGFFLSSLSPSSCPRRPRLSPPPPLALLHTPTDPPLQTHRPPPQRRAPRPVAQPAGGARPLRQRQALRRARGRPAVLQPGVHGHRPQQVGAGGRGLGSRGRGGAGGGVGVCGFGEWQTGISRPPPTPLILFPPLQNKQGGGHGAAAQAGRADGGGAL
jgi:hypothetical protein